MNKFQIVEVTKGLNHAGSKATADAATIAEQLGFKKAIIRMDDTHAGIIGKIDRQLTFLNDWNNCYKEIKDESIVLLQHPFHYPQITRQHILYKLKKEKKVKYISLVHDVEELRKFRNNEYYRKEFEVMIDIADYIIVHNDVMKEFFVNKGISKSKLISLEIFDYLQDNSIAKKDFLKQVIIAGNLDVEKSSYIAQLNQLEDIKFKLYGPNFSSKLENSSNIEYCGICTPEEIITKLTGGFGLVWDGNSINSCSGNSGNYLRYNNPHKLSMYLSAGLPVIVWKEAALANFVEENGVGLLVDSLFDISTKFGELDQSSYMMMCSNALKVSHKLTSGFYLNKALRKSLM